MIFWRNALRHLEGNFVCVLRMKRGNTSTYRHSTRKTNI